MLKNIFCDLEFVGKTFFGNWNLFEIFCLENWNLSEKFFLKKLFQEKCHTNDVNDFFKFVKTSGLINFQS